MYRKVRYSAKAIPHSDAPTMTIFISIITRGIITNLGDVINKENLSLSLSSFFTSFSQLLRFSEIIGNLYSACLRGLTGIILSKQDTKGCTRVCKVVYTMLTFYPFIYL